VLLLLAIMSYQIFRSQLLGHHNQLWIRVAVSKGLIQVAKAPILLGDALTCKLFHLVVQLPTIDALIGTKRRHAFDRTLWERLAVLERKDALFRWKYVACKSGHESVTRHRVNTWHAIRSTTNQQQLTLLCVCVCVCARDILAFLLRPKEDVVRKVQSVHFETAFATTALFMSLNIAQWNLQSLCNNPNNSSSGNGDVSVVRESNSKQLYIPHQCHGRLAGSLSNTTFPALEPCFHRCTDVGKLLVPVR
jgi:hypothetical protein